TPDPGSGRPAAATPQDGHRLRAELGSARLFPVAHASRRGGWLSCREHRGPSAMNPEQVRTAADARSIVEERGITHVKIGVFDADGVLRGKYISAIGSFSALESGLAFCDVVLGWGSDDQLYDNVTFTGLHTAYPDAPVRIVPESCREIPFED